MNRISTYGAAIGVLITGLLAIPFAQAEIYPLRVSSSSLDTAPYSSAGVLFTEIAGFSWRGSAVVARDPRLLYTCAHVMYEDGSWATNIEFARRWHSSVSPSSSQVVAVRGYRHYATYAGSNNAADFALDFAIGYSTATTTFGPAVGYQEDGGPSLRSSSTPKLILGYPAYRDYDDVSGYYYQHRTGPFTAAMHQSYDSYHTLSGVSTGGGSSGGPVLAYVGGQYSLAGILVSGSSSSIGVHGLNAASSTMAKNVLAYLGVSSAATTTTPSGATKTVANTSALLLPDGAAAYSSRSLAVSGLPASTTATAFSLRIDTTYRGDLDVYLRSPSGRVYWVNKHSLTASALNLVLNNANYTSTFAGSNPNGTWQVYMRDYYRGDRASFKSTSLTITSR